jgi:aspartate aminotransferase
LNPHVEGRRTSATVAINERSNALRAEGRTIYKLGLGQSPFPVPPPIVEALRTHAHEKDYLPVRGLAALREAVADHARRTLGIARDASDVLVGPGSKELMFLLQLCHRGELLVPNPSWVSYQPQAQLLGRPVRWIPTRPEDDFMLGGDALDRACSEGPDVPRVLILNYPSNPTGATLSAPRRRALAEVARRHSILVVSDEIYGEVDHAGTHGSIATDYPEGTIVSGGLSKWCGAGGWRLGTFVFPKELSWLLDPMAVAASETYTSVSAPIQHAAVSAFDGSADLGDYLARSRRVLGALGRWCHERLDSAGVTAPAPAGGFYLFADFAAHREGLEARGIDDSGTLCERILEETGVAILPGTDFGRPREELTTRLAYVDFDGKSALAHAGPDVELCEDWLATRCASVVTAIEAVCRWLSRG